MLRCLRLALLLALSALPLAFGRAASAPARQAYDSAAPVIARITAKTSEAQQRLSASGLDLLEMRDGADFFVLTTRSQVERLRAVGWPIAIDAQQTALLGQPGVQTFQSGYREVSELRAALEAAEASYPRLADFFTFGMSWSNERELFGITLTNQQIPGPKPTFFLVAGLHAREITTPELALRLAEQLLSGYGRDGDLTWLLDEHRIVIVPNANPDGHRLAAQGYLQRKNTHKHENSEDVPCSEPPTAYSQYGVDLNRNSAFKWGRVDGSSGWPCDQTYRGTGPASEPETAALQNLVRSLFEDQRGPDDSDAAPDSATGVLITLHAYSDLVLYPWGWTNSPAPNAAGLSQIAGKLAAYNGYAPGQSGRDLYLTSGTTDDWSYGELGIASFTFEVGPRSGGCAGFMPSYSCIDGEDGSPRAFWPENRPALLYAARIARAPYRLARGPTTEAITATVVSSDSVMLAAQLDERQNGGQPIHAASYYINVPPWRGGTPVAMTAADGVFDEPNERVLAGIEPLAGRHLIYVHGRDADGNWGPLRAQYVAVLAVKQQLPLMSR